MWFLWIGICSVARAFVGGERVEVERLDPRFDSIVPRGAELGLVAFMKAARTEGLVWLPSMDAVAFTTGNCPTTVGWDDTFMVRSDGTLENVVHPSGHANGQTLGADSRSILVCETTGRQLALIRLGEDGRVRAKTSILTHVGPHRLNSPNDVVMRSDGSIWLTDPSYGCIQFPNQKCTLPDSVYRFDPATRTVHPVLVGLDKPNGLAFGVDETTMYVVDSGAMHGSFDPTRPHAVFQFDVVGEGNGTRLENGRLFADIKPGIPDGVRVDKAGNVYVAAGDGVQIFDARGKLLGKVHTPPHTSAAVYGQCSNLEFGLVLGGNRSSPAHALYLATGPAVFAIPLASAWPGPAARRPSAPPQW